MPVLFEEKHPGKGIRWTCKNGDCWEKTALCNQQGKKVSSWFSIKQMLKEIFLPTGYPDSVCSDYLTYQIWDSLQAFGSSITGTLATHNVLKGIGVGNQSASVMSATLTWLLKDGTGMIGRIVFTYFKGSNLDVDCKKWRLFADIINDFAIGLDMICPMFPGHLILLQCSSGLIKSLVGTIGGATRAALTQHQARNNNLADVSAKDASQETLVNLVALITSLVLVPLIAESNSLIWILFLLLTIGHIYCNYRAVKSVNMEIFNSARWLWFIEGYMGEILISGSVEEVNQRENIWLFSSHPLQDKIHSGLPLSVQNLTDEQLDDLTENFDDWEYIISVDDQKHVLISFIEGQDSVRTKMKAYFHGYIIHLLSNYPTVDSIDERARSLVKSRFDSVVNHATNKGWNLSNFLFLENGWRVTMNLSGCEDDKKSI